MSTEQESEQESESLTHEEHEARAMLMGRDYWAHCNVYAGADYTFLDALTMKPIEHEIVLYRITKSLYAWGPKGR